MGSDMETRIRHVTAVLGPTNTGKTHLAIERMLGHESGMIGLPLRLLAREVYDKIAARVGADKVALITGEEKIRPERARYWVATVEAMPRDIDVDFLAIDEVQLCGDPERGHVFTDRLLHSRGLKETLLLGAQTMREAIADLIPGANFISRPRLSKLTYAGEKKITRLPTRSAVVAFSASDVYSIAELIRRQRGGAAVVLGALSPRTRNAQVALYQSGDVDFLVASDAIGMGLNLDVDHVAFAGVRKFDGQAHRNLTPSEMGQIAGRAGRHMNDGTFGVTGGVPPLEPDLVERLENHSFDSVRVLQWRNRKLEFRTLDALRESLRDMPREQRLVRARMADDVEALETVSRDSEVVAMARAPAAVAKLWDVCQVPDYRKVSPGAHAEMIATLYKFLMGPEERIPEDWFARHVDFADRTDGDIDTLANRIAHIRTWTFVSNRAEWLKDPAHWQGRTREIEDKLSDALHERLTQRFVDRRTSALMKGMRDKDELTAEISDDGSIHVENHFVGRLRGFQFKADTAADGIHGKATRHAAAQVLSRELGMRARRVAAAKADAFKVTRNGRVLWRDEEIARLEPADDRLKPSVVLLADEHLSAGDRERVQARLDAWIAETVAERLKPLVDIVKAEDLTGLARGIAFRMSESFGVLKRELIAEEIKSLDQPARASLRKYGVRFGAFNIFIPLLLKPAASEMILTLWSLKHAGENGLSLDALPEPPRAGLTSVAANAAIPEPFYRSAGFHLCGPRAVRIDILERLADLIRPLLAWRASGENQTAPKGSTGDGGFTILPEMMSILGCSPDELGDVLKALGFRLDRHRVTAPASTAAAASVDADAGSTASEAAAEPTIGDAPEVPVAATPSETVAAAEAPAVSVEPSGEVAPASAAATEAVEASGPSAPAVAEPSETFIDIWRPRRHRAEQGAREQHRGRRGGRGGARGRQGHAGGAPGGTGQPEAGGEAVPVAAAAAAGEGGERQERHERRDRHERQGREGGERGNRPEGQQHRDRNRDRDRSRGQGGEQRQGGRSEGRGEGRQEGRGGGDRRRRDEQRGGKPQVISAAPRGAKKGTVDPDSPFAKLSALKEAMEKRSKESSTP
ncbi:MAG: DEAD/DEAH box helicase [Hyphomicrobiaceae bacterium]|nr:DEAD/DEAH box helicase [Hyphomicrobiaceae bacterium]